VYYRNSLSPLQLDAIEDMERKEQAARRHEHEEALRRVQQQAAQAPQEPAPEPPLTPETAMTQAHAPMKDLHIPKPIPRPPEGRKTRTGEITGVSRATFEMVRDNPGLPRKQIVQLLAKQGFNDGSVSSLVGQMEKHGIFHIEGEDRRVTTQLTEYQPFPKVPSKNPRGPRKPRDHSDEARNHTRGVLDEVLKPRRVSGLDSLDAAHRDASKQHGSGKPLKVRQVLDMVEQRANNPTSPGAASDVLNMTAQQLVDVMPIGRAREVFALLSRFFEG
jgi:hypothetical protein